MEFICYRLSSLAGRGCLFCLFVVLIFEYLHSKSYLNNSASEEETTSFDLLFWPPLTTETTLNLGGLPNWCVNVNCHTLSGWVRLILSRFRLWCCSIDIEFKSVASSQKDKVTEKTQKLFKIFNKWGGGITRPSPIDYFPLSFVIKQVNRHPACTSVTLLVTTAATTMRYQTSCYFRSLNGAWFTKRNAQDTNNQGDVKIYASI